MADKFDMIEAMSVLTVEAGDTIVLKTTIPVSLEQRQWIEKLVSERLKAPAMLLDNGLDIGVLRQAA